MNKELRIAVKKELVDDALNWLRIVTSVLLFALLLFGFVVANAGVNQFSMRATLMDGDRIIALRLAYVLSEPDIYDIVVFYREPGGELFIKRVLGTPGDEVNILGGVVFVNGEPVDSSFVYGEPFGDFPSVVVPDGHVFVLGDNRNNSIDSRHWPEIYIPHSNILGRAIFRYWPGFRILLWD